MFNKTNLHKVPENKREYENWLKKIAEQELESNTIDGEITCVCDLSYEIKYLYRCYYCGIWFCPVCAKKHFGKRPKGKFTYKEYCKEKNDEEVKTYEGLNFIDITEIPITLKDWNEYKPDPIFNKKITGVNKENKDE